MPVVAFGAVDSIQGLTIAIVNVVWVVAAGAAVIFFVFAGLMFLTAQGDSGKLNTAKQAAIWGTVGIIVMVLSFSMINLAQRIVS